MKLSIRMRHMAMSLVCYLLSIAYSNAQVVPADSLAHFYVHKNALVWQKQYPLVDEHALDEALKAHPFSAELELAKFQNSVETGPFRLPGENLPEYARHDFKAFLYVDIIGDTFRVTVKQILFPDFVEKIYWNGMRQADARGSLEHYVMGKGGKIKRNSTNERVLGYFDAYFGQIFDPMSQ